MKEILDRLRAETPKFFKKLLYWSGAIGAIGVTVLATPHTFPEWLVSIADDLIKIGATAALVAAHARKDSPSEQ